MDGVSTGRDGALSLWELRSGVVRGWLAIGLLVTTACAGGEDTVPSTTHRLAPTQLSASTIARPDTPPPCDPADLAWWTARATLVDSTSTATVRVRNDGSSWCEVDVAESPTLAADAEPNVWLESGEWGDLIVGSNDGRCSPTVFDTVDVVVGRVTVEVPSVVVAACEPSLLAFFVADPPDRRCTDLDAVVVDRAVVVRNAGFSSCELGLVVGVVDDEEDDDEEGEGVSITSLAGGDVVAIDLVPVGGECPAALATVEFETAGAIAVDGLNGCPVRGAARPWFGNSASTSLPGDVLDDLDPFA